MSLTSEERWMCKKIEEWILEQREADEIAEREPSDNQEAKIERESSGESDSRQFPDSTSKA